MMIPAPRLPSDPRPVPFRLLWPRARIRPVIGDALLAQHPEVAKTLAERSHAAILLHSLQRSSMQSMVELTVRQARELLTEWATVVADRDARVITAYESGVSKAEIARLTGIARTTVDRILEGVQGDD